MKSVFDRIVARGYLFALVPLGLFQDPTVSDMFPTDVNEAAVITMVASLLGVPIFSWFLIMTAALGVAYALFRLYKRLTRRVG